MVGSGNLNKSDGDIFYADDVIETVNTHGNFFKLQANLLYNSSLIGFNAGLTNKITDVVKYSTDPLSGSGTELYSAPVFGAVILDEHSDGVVDTDIWTVAYSGVGDAGVTETANGMVVMAKRAASTTTTTATADQTDAPDLRNSNTNSTLFIRSNYYATDGGSGSSGTISLWDGSTGVGLISYSGAGSTTTNYVYRIEINPSLNKAYVYTNDINGSGTPAEINISGLSDVAAWRLKYTAVSDGGGVYTYLTIGFDRYLLNVSAEADWLSDSTTFGETIKSAILTANISLGTNSSNVYYLSANNGTNWEQVNLEETHWFTNTGTQLRVKIVSTSGTKEVACMHHYAVLINPNYY